MTMAESIATEATAETAMTATTFGLTIFFSKVTSRTVDFVREIVSALRRSQDRFFETKIERFFWRDFSGEEFREKHYCPYNFVPINWLWSGFIFPELEHL